MSKYLINGLAIAFVTLLLACNQKNDFAQIQAQATQQKMDVHKFDSIKPDSLHK